MTGGPIAASDHAVQPASIREDLERLAANLQQFASQLREKHILVSGGAGFIGSWFCDLAVLMDARVTCVDTLIASSTDGIAHLLDHPRFHFVQEDICGFDLPDDLDFIAHMASIASPPLYQRFPKDTLDSGILGVRHLLEYALHHPLSGFLVASTSEIYGNPLDGHIPTPETYNGAVSSYGPRSMYDESKRAQEAYCYAYFTEARRMGHSIPIRIARIFNTYGPRLDLGQGSQYSRVLTKFIAQALTGDDITVYGDGEQTRSFCYVTDQVAGLYRTMLTNGYDGEIFNIGNDRETSLQELAAIIKTQTGSESSITTWSDPSYDLTGDPRRRRPDITRARESLGFAPSVSLEEGIGRTIRWVRGVVTA